MTHQACSLEMLQPAYAPQRTFSERFGYLGTCVLPAEMLDDTTLLDPDTGQMLPSLRQSCSQDGLLCYAHILYACAEGLYQADVAATPDLAEADRVVLTEAQLIFALAWDERLFWRTPLEIRRIMQAHAEDLAPLVPYPEPAPTVARFTVPVEPLTIVTTVEVTTQELREALEAQDVSHCSDTPTHAYLSRPGVSAVQNGLFHALSRALQKLLATTPDPSTAHVLQALIALVRRVERWQRQTRQRVVNAVFELATAWNCPSWVLTLGVPEVLLSASECSGERCQR
jgi:hypothetical protein